MPTILKKNNLPNSVIYALQAYSWNTRETTKKKRENMYKKKETFISLLFIIKKIIIY